MDPGRRAGSRFSGNRSIARGTPGGLLSLVGAARSRQEVWDGSSKHNTEPHHVLVVDIGGGTSDFSLFEFRPHAASGGPRIKRIAVSNHILLGGDNIDLA